MVFNTCPVSLFFSWEADLCQGIHLQPDSLVGSRELCPSYLDSIALKVTLLPTRSPTPLQPYLNLSEVLPVSGLISGTRSLSYGVMLWRSSSCFEQFGSCLSFMSLWFWCLGAVLVLARNLSLHIPRAAL